ncbi:MAG: hypothetical protein IKJ07_00150 [Clostridia bacterium]|nr:hypothetical protein [Clostridia bacterium]
MIKDLTGQRFGRLTVIEFAGSKNRRAYWKCKCDCGNICVINGHNLGTGNTKSCGCLHDERIIKDSITHGQSGTKIYRTWKDMKARCFNPNRRGFCNYGGRGITVCDEWRDNFQAFFDCVSKLEHFGEEGYSLDRVDVNGNYEPQNVRWATRKEQGRNKRNNVIVEYKGEKMTLAEAAEKSGIKKKILETRHERGWSDRNLFADVIPQPRKPRF